MSALRDYVGPLTRKGNFGDVNIYNAVAYLEALAAYGHVDKEELAAALKAAPRVVVADRYWELGR